MACMQPPARQLRTVASVAIQAWRGVETKRQQLRDVRVAQLALVGVSMLGSMLAMKWAFSQLDPNKDAKTRAKGRKKELQARLGRKVDLVGYEDNIALDVVNPDDIDTRLSDIGGLDDIIESMTNRIIAPLEQPKLFQSRLLRLPRGVLLYGPPGTGKTMLAKALAKESGAMFVNIRASSIMSKWFGDSQKLVSAIFSLACKLQPSIIFIDEADAMLGQRREQEHEALTQMKTEFMQLWDGFLTDSNAAVLVLAATNRPYDLDDAVMRRFTHQYEVALPNEVQREAILRLSLDKHVAEGAEPRVAPALLADRLPLQDISRRCAGFSGSDLVELCSQAASVPVHAWLAQHRAGGTAAAPAMTPLSFAHFDAALQGFKPAMQHAQAYKRRQAGGDGDIGLQQLLQALLSASGESQQGAPSGGSGNGGSDPPNGRSV